MLAKFRPKLPSLQKILLAVEVSEDHMRPRGYGFGYRDYERRSVIAYPLGIHLLVGLARRFYFWLLWPTGFERAEVNFWHFQQSMNEAFTHYLRLRDENEHENTPSV